MAHPLIWPEFRPIKKQGDDLNSGEVQGFLLLSWFREGGGSREEEEILSTQKRGEGLAGWSLGSVWRGRQKGVPKVSFFAFPSGS